MIVRYVGDEFLADRALIAAHYQLSASTIRAQLQPVACDVITRAALYWIDDASIERMTATRRNAAYLRNGQDAYSIPA